jgi:glycosyltransferase involved in cell wall biosynthesis
MKKPLPIQSVVSRKDRFFAEDIHPAASPIRTADPSPLKITIVTNNPAPYRVPVFDRLSRLPGVSLHVVFCSQREPYRLWDVPPMQFEHTYLPESFFILNGKYVHNNPSVIPVLRRLRPDVVITNGYFPTQLYAFGYAVAAGAGHVPLTDGTDVSERALSRVHRAVRRVVFSRSGAFVSASAGGGRLFAGYGIPPERRFQSCLCVDNDAFRAVGAQPEKRYDFIFCGRIEAAKGPLFALDVAVQSARLLGRKTRILFVGAGEQEQEARDLALRHADHVEAEFHGFATQAELPGLYQSARIFLFPTLADVWGVVANEACAAGLPVIVSPFAGVAGELIRDGENGFVCDLDAGLWAQKAALLLASQATWSGFSENSLRQVSNFSFDHAAAGLLAASRHAASLRKKART